MNAFISGLGL